MWEKLWECVCCGQLVVFLWCILPAVGVVGCTVTVVDEQWVSDEMESGRSILAVLSELLPKRTEERTERVMD
jgi:hypothetical protein